ncbi:MAG: bi-domain-containing oxidoreductase [Acidobacteriota bacterium]
MKQLVQNLKTGEIRLVDSPTPVRPPGSLLVATRASLISAGTERATVQAARASLLGKARQRPDKVRQVLDNLRREGLVATLRKVREKLDEPSLLGYSSAGVVLEADPDDPRFAAGDAIACGGQDVASHAEIVAVPRTLAAPVPESVPFEQAAFATVGAIALQGIRRADVRVGERVLVIGLGLIGQITWQLLRGAGCVPIGTDVSEPMVELARRLGLEHAAVRGRDDVEALCRRLGDGHGVDAVIIAAAAKSGDPIELAGEVCRERGRVVVVGAVPMNVPREPYYRKELDLVVSRSYGPGRYDPQHEQHGVDYPYGFVRWTEGRNMQAVLEAIAAGSLDVASLITHRFPFERATEAYAIVSGERPEPHVGIVLEYAGEPARVTRIERRPAPPAGDRALGIGFIGAGSFARSYLLPHLRGREGVRLEAVATARGFTASEIARRFEFRVAASDPREVLEDPAIDAVFIATRHDAHARLVLAALAAGKHVFVEKPLCLTDDELAELRGAIAAGDRIVQVGFNRRFSPLARTLREVVAASGEPVQVTCRVSAGPLPEDHWLNDPRVGGGRILGEGCHFVDLMQFFVGALPQTVSATRFGVDATGATSALIEFCGGATGVLVYQANAPRTVRKERIEVFAGGRGGVIDDWRRAEIHDGGRVRTAKARGQAKGYREEIDAFLDAIRTGRPAIDPDALLAVTAATLAIPKAAAARRTIVLGEERQST